MIVSGFGVAAVRRSAAAAFSQLELSDDARRRLFGGVSVQLFPEQEVQEVAQDIALPGQPNLAMRVLTLEGVVADLQERLAQLEA